jgi:hypothetical protein
LQGGRPMSLWTPFTRKEGVQAGSSAPLERGALADVLEPGKVGELPSWEVLLADVLEPGKVFELPSWEVLLADVLEPGKVFELPSREVFWLMSSSLAGMASW